MSETTRARRRPTSSLALEVSCPVCEVEVDQRCVSRPSGRPRSVGQEHVDRWNKVRFAYSKPRRYVLHDDDPRFALRAGDVLVCKPYRLDPVQLTVLYRESDGFDPECNVYRRQVNSVRGDAGKVDSPAVRAAGR